MQKHKTAFVMLAIDSDGHVFMGDRVSHTNDIQWQQSQIATLWGYDIDTSARFYAVSCSLPIPSARAETVAGDVAEVPDFDWRYVSRLPFQSVVTIREDEE